MQQITQSNDRELRVAWNRGAARAIHVCPRARDSHRQGVYGMPDGELRLPATNHVEFLPLQGVMAAGYPHSRRSRSTR